MCHSQVKLLSNYSQVTLKLLSSYSQVTLKSSSSPSGYSQVTLSKVTLNVIPVSCENCKFTGMMICIYCPILFSKSMPQNKIYFHQLEWKHTKTIIIAKLQYTWIERYLGEKVELRDTYKRETWTERNFEQRDFGFNSGSQINVVIPSIWSGLEFALPQSHPSTHTHTQTLRKLRQLKLKHVLARHQDKNNQTQNCI